MKLKWATETKELSFLTRKRFARRKIRDWILQEHCENVTIKTVKELAAPARQSADTLHTVFVHHGLVFKSA